MKIAPPRNEELIAPWSHLSMVSKCFNFHLMLIATLH